MAKRTSDSILVPDSAAVYRWSEVVEWVVENQQGVVAAAEHFGCSTSQIRRILSESGLRPVRQATLWGQPE